MEILIDLKIKMFYERVGIMPTYILISEDMKAFSSISKYKSCIIKIIPNTTNLFLVCIL